MLLPRAGRLTVEDSESIISDVDTQGPLHVSRGLRVADQAAFLGFKPKNKFERERLTEGSVGYLVTHVDPDGSSGILVSGDFLERDPGSWLTERVIGAWEYLSGEGYSPSEFGLDGLTAYLSQQSRTKSL